MAPTDPDYVFNELLRLRALLARARGDEAGDRCYAKDHGELANSIGFAQSMSPAVAVSSSRTANRRAAPAGRSA